MRFATSSTKNLTTCYIGRPLQFTTDCGSETTQLHKLASALWFVCFFAISIVSNSSGLYLKEILHLNIDLQELPAHIYLHNVYNISIEHSWLQLQLDWGNSAVTVCESDIFLFYFILFF